MPEGPEIRLAADKVEAVLKNKTIEKIEFGLKPLKRYINKLEGARITRLETRGKALLTHFDNGYSIYSHNQLYGIWYAVKRNQYPNTNRQLRLALHTTSDSALLYSASDISVWLTKELDQHPFLKKIGPDILSPDLCWQDIAERLQAKPFSTRVLSSVYLDQAFLAGLGNYLRSEILFCAGIHPTRKANELSKRELGKLARITLEISLQSYKLKGVTVSERNYKALRKSGLNYEKSRFYVFGRKGMACRTCGTEIQRLTLNSRRLYLCEHCQPDTKS